MSADRHVIVTSLTLPVGNCCLQLLFCSPPLCEHFVAVNRSRAEEGVFWRLRMLAPEIAINRHGGAAHSRFAVEEIDLICNHKFV
jgi:hypothetical protein